MRTYPKQAQASYATLSPSRQNRAESEWPLGMTFSSAVLFFLSPLPSPVPFLYLFVFELPSLALFVHCFSLGYSRSFGSLGFVG
jgi:hypothetical protein